MCSSDLGIALFLSIFLVHTLLMGRCNVDSQEIQRSTLSGFESFDSQGILVNICSFMECETILRILFILVNILGGLIVGFLSGAFGSVAELAAHCTFLTIGSSLAHLVSAILATLALRIAFCRERDGIE